MTQTGPRIHLPELSPEEREAERRRQLAVLDRNRKLRERILQRRGGVPIEVDDLLDEIRGRARDDD